MRKIDIKVAFPFRIKEFSTFELSANYIQARPKKFVSWNPFSRMLKRCLIFDLKICAKIYKNGDSHYSELQIYGVLNQFSRLGVVTQKS